MAAMNTFHFTCSAAESLYGVPVVLYAIHLIFQVLWQAACGLPIFFSFSVLHIAILTIVVGTSECMVSPSPTSFHYRNLCVLLVWFWVKRSVFHDLWPENIPNLFWQSIWNVDNLTFLHRTVVYFLQILFNLSFCQCIHILSTWSRNLPYFYFLHYMQPFSPVTHLSQNHTHNYYCN